LLSPGEDPESRVSRETRRRVDRRVSGRPPHAANGPPPAPRRVRLPGLASHALSSRLDRLPQAPVWRTEPRAALSGAVHAPGRHLQSSARRCEGRSGDVSVEGLPPREPGPLHDPERGGISPALLPPRAAERLRANPVLRVSSPSLSHRDFGLLPAGARGESTPRPPPRTPPA